MPETHPQNRRLSYARVSTYGQTLDAQLEQLRGAGCGKIYREKVTAAQQNEARRRRAQGATLAELARSYSVGKSTISRL